MMIFFITTIFIITRHDIIIINNDKRIVVRESLLEIIHNHCYNKIITSDDHIITSDDRIITSNEKIIDVNNHRYESIFFVVKYLSKSLFKKHGKYIINHC